MFGNRMTSGILLLTLAVLAVLRARMGGSHGEGDVSSTHELAFDTVLVTTRTAKDTYRAQFLVQGAIVAESSKAIADALRDGGDGVSLPEGGPVKRIDASGGGLAIAGSRVVSIELDAPPEALHVLLDCIHHHELAPKLSLCTAMTVANLADRLGCPDVLVCVRDFIAEKIEGEDLSDDAMKLLPVLVLSDRLGWTTIVQRVVDYLSSRGSERARSALKLRRPKKSLANQSIYEIFSSPQASATIVGLGVLATIVLQSRHACGLWSNYYRLQRIGCEGLVVCSGLALAHLSKRASYVLPRRNPWRPFVRGTGLLLGGSVVAIGLSLLKVPGRD